MFRPSYTRLSVRGYALFKDLSKKTINPAPSSVNATNSAIPPMSSSVAGATINQLNGTSNMANSNATVNGEIEPETSASHFSLHDSPIGSSLPNGQINWSDSFYGLGQAPFSSQINEILLAPLKDEDIEITPDGLIYLPEIKYRRILNRDFGPGVWGLAPRTETYITPKQISREYALVCHGRLVSVARGEQDYFGGEEKITTALEGCKSNALMRCCKDLGIASELWDPSFIKPWKQKFCDEVFAEHVVTKRKKKLWKLKRNKSLDYPYKQT